MFDKMSIGQLSWGIIGTGSIAKTFARHLKRSKSGRLAAVSSRTMQGAEAFAREHDIPHAFSPASELLASGEIDAVYVSSPHPSHYGLCMEALAADKHILCEKPLCMRSTDAQDVFETARIKRKIVMEAFMYRCHPQTKKILEIVREGRLGEIKLLEASFCFAMADDPSHRLLNRSMGGGGIMDVGCYCMSFARLIAGAICGKPFTEPTSISGCGMLHQRERTDTLATALLNFDDKMLATLTCGVGLKHHLSAHLYGDRARMTIPQPWLPSREGGSSAIEIHHHDGKIETIRTDCSQWLYEIEADVFASAIMAGKIEPPAMTPDDSLGNILALEQWLEAVGVTYL